MRAPLPCLFRLAQLCRRGEELDARPIDDEDVDVSTNQQAVLVIEEEAVRRPIGRPPLARHRGWTIPRRSSVFTPLACIKGGLTAVPAGKPLTQARA